MEHNSDDYPSIQEFLDTLRTKDNKFKRVCTTPLRYAGGKTKAVGIILDNIPQLHEKKIVSIFMGGGSVELVLSSKLGFKVIGYDIFEMLVNFWNIFIYRRAEFIKELEKFKITKEEFTYNRHVLLNYWNKIKPDDLDYKTKRNVVLDTKDLTILDDDKLLQAVYYYYNMTLSYGPMFLGWPSSNEINPEKFNRKLERIRRLEVGDITVRCADFEQSIKNHPEDFLYLDPPYYLGDDSKMFKGIYPNSNFAIHHNDFDHRKLYRLLSEHRGGFIMTYNNCKTILEMYSDYQMVFPSWQYTFGQGETRIGKNRTNTTTKESHEVLIICPPKN